MKAAVISQGSVSSLWTIDAMKKYFDTVENVSIKDIEITLCNGRLEVQYNGSQLPEFDCIYAKGSFRFAPFLRPTTEAPSQKTSMPLPPASSSTAHDKIPTHLILQNHKIPMPKTYLSST